jgi:protein involved in polysaccharide export with SLBB domain
MMLRVYTASRILLSASLLLAFAVGLASAQPALPFNDASPVPPAGAPVRLAQPSQMTPRVEPASEIAPVAARAVLVGDFEAFARLPRFGSDVVAKLAAGAPDHAPLVPRDYILQTGDEVLITLWGSVEADLRLVVDPTGRVSVPRVGSIQVSGVRFSDLESLVTRRVEQVFRNFQISVGVGRLRGVRVLVTGYVERPGAYVVSSLSSAMTAVMRAGGPSGAGSYRRIEVRRGAEVVSRIDLYDLLLRGQRRGDIVLQPDDVVHVAPAETLAAVAGSVNKPAVYELLPEDTLSELLEFAGGFSAVADRARVVVERLKDRSERRVVEWMLPAAKGERLQPGDVVRVLSVVDTVASTTPQNRRVRVEGEVRRPDVYILPPGSTLRDALRAAGGLTTDAFVFGTELSRESTREQQRRNYDRALGELETRLALLAATQRPSSSDAAVRSDPSGAVAGRLFERLRAEKPSGRLVLQLPPDATELPPLLVEDDDRIYVPPRPNSVGVFGSVFNAGTYLHADTRTLADTLRLAGGPTKGADEGSVFVVRANGQVVSSLQSRGFFQRGNTIGELAMLPGDTVFVPEELDKSTWIQAGKDWTQILYQFGLGVAGLRTWWR